MVSLRCSAGASVHSLATTLLSIARQDKAVARHDSRDRRGAPHEGFSVKEFSNAFFLSMAWPSLFLRIVGVRCSRARTGRGRRLADRHLGEIGRDISGASFRNGSLAVNVPHGGALPSRTCSFKQRSPVVSHSPPRAKGSDRRKQSSRSPPPVSEASGCSSGCRLRR